MNKSVNTVLLIVLAFLGVDLFFQAFGLDAETALAFTVAASFLITPFFLPHNTDDDDVDLDELDEHW